MIRAVWFAEGRTWVRYEDGFIASVGDGNIVATFIGLMGAP